jgi:hypothetical protein
MKFSRRSFIQSSILTGAGMILNPITRLTEFSQSTLIGVHPFILNNPGAVFIMQTNVDVKTDFDGCKKAGLEFGRSVFGFTDNPEEGVPVTNKIILKPNLTCRQRERDIYSWRGSMGIVTDSYFVEGIIESIKELSIPADQFYIREVNCPADLRDGGYEAMAERTRINIRCNNTPVGRLSPDLVQWTSIPEGKYFKMIPYLWPVNASYTFLINIAKFKAHSMGLTLCAKNLQGTIAMNYQAHCTKYSNLMTGVSSEHISGTADTDIFENYNRHLKKGIPRWDKPGEDGGLWQETWATRCLDNNSVTFAGLHIIEGIYGRDGNFLDGPDPQGLATDYMTNYIIFGKNQFYVDIIGHYLGGHEPGNFGLFHMARERNMISTFNPWDIKVYDWDPLNGPILKELTFFTRYPLKTLYLQRNYNGYDEPKWHLVDEPFDYSVVGINDPTIDSNSFSIWQNYPNPVQSKTMISFYIPAHGYVNVEVLNSNGQIVDKLVNKQITGGEHSITLDCNDYPSGYYFCQIRYCSLSKTIKMIVLH